MAGWHALSKIPGLDCRKSSKAQQSSSTQACPRAAMAVRRRPLRRRLAALPHTTSWYLSAGIFADYWCMGSLAMQTSMLAQC